jgi:pyridoxine 5-phosphate synthase
MTFLSVNVNKIATLRNARGGSMPDVLLAAQRIEGYGAHGITVHPRPDERHITYADVRALKPLIQGEFNVEGYPSKSFLALVDEVRPHQVTLVPDPPDALTSNAGWDAVSQAEFLAPIIADLQAKGMRVSLFLAPDSDQIQAAARLRTDRIELYTEPYAAAFPTQGADAALPFARAAVLAHALGLGVNAGHDLNATNLRAFAETVPYLDEVSIGHALISDALYMGLSNAVATYRACLEPIPA